MNLKKLILFAVGFIASILLMGFFASGGSNNERGYSLARIDVDTSRVVKMEFPDTRVKLFAWDKDYIEIRGTETFKSLDRNADSRAEITTEGNVIRLENYRHSQLAIMHVMPWITLMQFQNQSNRQDDFFVESISIEFLIYLPEDTLLDIDAASTWNYKVVEMVGD